MKARTSSTGNPIRLVILAAIVALLAISNVQGVAAQQNNDSVIDSSLSIWKKCEDAGGSPEMDTTISADGKFQTIIICNGGDLDGLVCGFTPTDSFCKFMWFAPELDDDVIAPIDEAVEVAPEPTQPPIIIEEPVVIEPVVDSGEDAAEATAEPVEPTPEPTAEPIVDGGEVVDEIAPPTEGTDDDGRELPEIQDGVVIEENIAPEPDKGSDDGGRQLEVDIKVTTDVIASDPVVAGP